MTASTTSRDIGLGRARGVQPERRVALGQAPVVVEQCELPCIIGKGFSCDADAETIAARLFAEVEDVAQDNTAWYLAEFLRGEERKAAGLSWTEPPCCAGCGGYKHDPDRPGNATIVYVVDVYSRFNEETGNYDMLCPSMSCGSAAAMSIGHERAVIIEKLAQDAGLLLAELIEDDEGLAEAMRQAEEHVQAIIEQGTPPGGGPSTRYFHAKYKKYGKVEDPTQEMERVS